MMARLAGWEPGGAPTATPTPGLVERVTTVFQNWGSSGPGDYFNDNKVNSLDFGSVLMNF